uniref:ZP domain-containing protein n=1 Tax=Plectus sambesii TaxID=2011161 RepID=A0A914V9I1_9BILA
MVSSFVLRAIVALTCFVSVVELFGDFVENVDCTAEGMVIALKKKLPVPRSGMWDLEVEGFPKCPGALKSDVGGGHEFLIRYTDKEWCGVEASSLLTPAWVTVAKVVLLLKDDNGTTIADSVSCVYDTRFDTSLMTFRGEISSQNLLYGGSLQEDGNDVETTVYSSEAIAMDFFDQVGRPLQQRTVKLGDPIMFKIDISKGKQVSRVLPENCYFSSSSIPEENLLIGQTLPFVKNSCFNSKNGMVRAFLPKMDRNHNGSSYEMRFPAFHFTDHGENLFVHCTILACLGSQKLCEPRSECFGVNRRKRDVNESWSDNKAVDDGKNAESKEMVITKYIVVEDQRRPPMAASRMPAADSSVLTADAVCMQTSHFFALTGTLSACLLALLVVSSCLLGRLLTRQRDESWADKRMFYASVYNHQPPNYASVHSLPTITSF